jgi:hypothetical protein
MRKSEEINRLEHAKTRRQIVGQGQEPNRTTARNGGGEN